jgi:S1-C subfamily serine protease
MNLLIKALLSAFAALAFAVWIGSHLSAAPKLAGATVRIETSDSIGSGVHIGNDFILTAAHVVEGETKVTFIADNGKDTYTADVQWSNRALDIALLKSRATNILETAPLLCGEPVIGSPVISAGIPLGITFYQSAGQVGSKPFPLQQWASLFMVAGPGAVGMSGGPVLDLHGRVIGITVAAPGRVGPFMYAVPGSAICPLLARV